jgi:Tol biopolymer transport system component
MGLTAEYFKLLDTNLNGALDPAEWSFQIIEPPKSRLFAMNADGSDVELLADVGLFDATYLGSPDWSPDGTTVVFDATPPRGTNSDFSKSLIVSLSLAGPAKGESKRLGYGNCPDWSPDGKQIAFFVNSGNPDGDPAGVWIMNADGTERRLLARDVYTPRWSPDGRSVLCCSNFSGPKNYTLVNVETARIKRILGRFVGLGVPDWEPGGNSLCVSLQLGNQRALCLIDITGDQDSIIELWKSDLHGIHDNSRPNCSQDGREIIFADNSSGTSVLKRVVTTGDEEPVVVASQLSHIDVNAVWSPDRKRIIFCSTQPLAEIPGLKKPKPK